MTQQKKVRGYFGWADRPEKAYYLNVVNAESPQEAMALFAKDATAIIYGRKVQSAIIVEEVTQESFRRNVSLGILP